MFFINLGTCSKWMFTLLSLAQRILLLIFQCHTVTHGTDLRRSPHGPYGTSTRPIPPSIMGHTGGGSGYLAFGRILSFEPEHST